MTTPKSKTQMRRMKIQMDDEYTKQAREIFETFKHTHGMNEKDGLRFVTASAEALRKLGQERDYFHDKFLETATTLQNFKAERDELKQKLNVAVGALEKLANAGIIVAKKALKKIGDVE